MNKLGFFDNLTFSKNFLYDFSIHSLLVLLDGFQSWMKILVFLDLSNPESVIEEAFFLLRYFLSLDLLHE